MSKVINLRQKRKQALRVESRKAADQNAALHGLAKSDKDLHKAKAVRAARVLDGHKRDA